MDKICAMSDGRCTEFIVVNIVVNSVVAGRLAAVLVIESQGCRGGSYGDYDDYYDDTTIFTTIKVLPGLGYYDYYDIFPIMQRKKVKEGKKRGIGRYIGKIS